MRRSFSNGILRSIGVLVFFLTAEAAAQQPPPGGPPPDGPPPTDDAAAATPPADPDSAQPGAAQPGAQATPPPAAAPAPAVSGQVSLGSGVQAEGADIDAPDDDDGEADEASKKNGLYADLSLGVLGIAYERVLGERVSLNVAAQYYRPWYESDDVFGFGGELRPFIFLTHEAPVGLYVSPSLRMAYVRADLPAEGTTPERTEEGFAWSAKATLGFSVVLWDVLGLRVGGGIQTHTVDLVADSREEPDFSGAYPALDAYVGAVF